MFTGRKRIFVALLSSILAASFLFLIAACGPLAHTEHELTQVALQNATCTEAGVAAHYRCTGCGKLFLDAEGMQEVTQSDLVIAPYGHEYSSHYRIDGEGHTRVCLVCGATETESHKLTAMPSLSANDARAGHTAGTGCSVCGYMTEGQTLPRSSLFTQQSHEGYDYCLYEPSEEVFESEEGKVPLVLFLHGAGERGNNNVSQLKNAIKKVVYAGSNSLFMNAVVIAPQCPSGAQWVDTPWADGNYTLADVPESENMQKVVSLVEYYAGLRYIDADRIYVVGLSMGGFGTWDLLARHSDLFAAGVPICGGGPTDAVETLKDMPIYTFHGTADGTVPYDGTRAMVRAIESAGGNKIHFVTFTGDGHSIWDKAICYAGDGDNEKMENWLFAQERQSSLAA